MNHKYGSSIGTRDNSLEIQLLVGFSGLMEGKKQICEKSNERWLKPFVLLNQGDFGTCIYQRDVNGNCHDELMTRSIGAITTNSLLDHVRTPI